ncbi:hypothetical protein [Metabacillus malikii]|uniref:Uncharacterized protein n=1 Tax=Metabacillus malikii TaxID=1504265 RepID=A0ABT9ZD48_9BACI|nr:hypothetical protein [Metabacillus malikii]MDQ0230184.1 hypothetical protein [Metabacillus malikii]
MINIQREASWSDKFRSYKVIVNEEEVGTIRQKETFQYPLKPGIHTLYLKIDWCRSEKFEFEIKEDETLNFQCGGLNGYQAFINLWYITFGRNKYLWMKQI